MKAIVSINLPFYFLNVIFISLDNSKGKVTKNYIFPESIISRECTKLKIWFVYFHYQYTTITIFFFPESNLLKTFAKPIKM